MRQQRMAEKRRRQQETSVKKSKSKKNSPIQSEFASPLGKDQQESDFDFKLELNEGDLELKPYLDPLLRSVGGNLRNLS